MLQLYGKKLSWFSLLLLGIQPLQAQVRDTILFPHITVKGSSLEPSTSVQYQADSLYAVSMPLANVGELLNASTPVFLKSYGGGASSTLSIRGTAASQNNLLWNGIQINAPTFGLADFSNMPFFLVDDAQVLYDADAGRYGSGSLGGAVQLSNSPDWRSKTGLNLQLGAGSFDNYRAGLRLRTGKNNWRNISRVFYHQANNDFSYSNTTLPGSPRERLPHAAFQQAAIMNECYFRIRKDNTVSIRAWWQEGSREIPPLLFNTGNPGSETQYDRAFRVMAELRIPQKRYEISLKSAYMDEVLIYRNPDAGIYGHYQTRSLKNLAMLQEQLGKKWGFEYLINDDRTWLLNNTQYQAPPSQYRLGLNASVHRKTSKTLYKLSLRQELIDNVLIPTIVQLGTRFSWKKSLFLSVNLQRNTRYPSLNDLYWIRGGNPLLKPELAHGGNISLEWAGKHLEYTGVVFGQYVTDWILWTPSASGFFSAQNLKEVRLLGTEQQLKANYSWRKHFFRLQVSWNYQSAINQKELFPGDGSKGKQLIYTPEHRVRAFLLWRWNQWGAFLQQQYTGYTYTSTDNRFWLEPYQLLDLGLTYRLPLKNSEWNLMARCNNILNQKYQMIAWRPMPERNFELMLQFKLNP